MNDLDFHLNNINESLNEIFQSQDDTNGMIQMVFDENCVMQGDIKKLKLELENIEKNNREDIANNNDYLITKISYRIIIILFCFTIAVFSCYYFFIFDKEQSDNNEIDYSTAQYVDELQRAGSVHETAYWTPDGGSFHTTPFCTSLHDSPDVYGSYIEDALDNGKIDPCNYCAVFSWSE